MENAKSSVLVLEDDETLGNALREALTREGHQVHFCLRPDEAFAVLARIEIDYIICDCLLPQMTGLDFIVNAHQRAPKSQFKTILMSGIYNDKVFIEEAIKKTNALTFLRKPFDLPEALKLVKKEGGVKKAEDSGEARKMLYQMFSNPKITTRQQRKLIESIEEVSGFDLPFIYSLLVETKSSGYLNLYHKNGSVSGITFCNGNIIGVDVEDKTTFLGEMLIQSGYALPEDVQEALRDKNNRRIGNTLIQENKLSPHALDLILAEQMNIRLSRTITEEIVKINFAAADIEMVSPYVDSDSLMAFLHDWIASKVSLVWLKKLYMTWASYVIVPGPAFSKTNAAFDMSLVKVMDGFLDNVEKRMTLHQLLNVPNYNERAVYKGLFFLLTRGQIVFEQRNVFASESEQLAGLKKMKEEVTGLDDSGMVVLMEALALDTTEKEHILREFLNLLGLQPSDTSSELHRLWTELRMKAENSFSLASDQQQRTEFIEASAKSDVEAKLHAGRLLEEAKQALQLNQFPKASKMLAQVAELSPQIGQLHLLSAWAKLGSMDPLRKTIQIKEIEIEIMQVAPDERYDAVFPYVMALFSKVKGDVAGARKSFEKSIALDPGFIVARRELNLLELQNKKQDILKMDLREMVSGFFKKKG